MYSLIRFEGDTICKIHKTSLITLDSSGIKYCAKYNGSKYSIEKVFSTNGKEILEELMFNLNNGIPFIEIETYKGDTEEDSNNTQSLSAPESHQDGETHLEINANKLNLVDSECNQNDLNDGCGAPQYFPTSSVPFDVGNEAVEKIGSGEALSTRDVDEDDDVRDPDYCPSSSGSYDEEYQAPEESICFSELYDQYYKNFNINNNIDTDVEQGQLGCNDDQQTCSSYHKTREALATDDTQLNVSISGCRAKTYPNSQKLHSCYYCEFSNCQTFNKNAFKRKSCESSLDI